MEALSNSKRRRRSPAARRNRYDAAESSGAPGWLLHAAGLILLAGRLLHAFGRGAGMLATWVAVLLGGGASLYLAVAA